MSKSVVEVVYVNGTKSYNSTYETSGQSKMIIIQDDDDETDEDKFPPPRLCLLRKWPTFDGGFGFSLCDDLLNSTGSLKVKNIIKNSPAEVGGLKINDILIEVNGEYVEYKSFFHLIEILKEAFNKQEIELLVVTDEDAEWYRRKGISINSNFPNIQYCETPYYGFKFRDMSLKDISSNIIGFGDTRRINSHLSLKKEKPKTYIINTSEDKIHKYSQPISLKKSQSLKNNFDVDENHNFTFDKNKSYQNLLNTDSNDNPTSNTDTLHDSWSEVIDKYLEIMNNKSTENLSSSNNEKEKTKAKNEIKLSSERSRSLNSARKQPAFSFLFSGRDDYSEDLQPSLYTNQINNFRPISKQYQKEKPVQPIKAMFNNKPNVIYKHNVNDVENIKPTSKIEHASPKPSFKNNIPKELNDELNNYKNIKPVDEPKIKDKSPIPASPILKQKLVLHKQAPIKVEKEEAKLSFVPIRAPKSPEIIVKHEEHAELPPPPPTPDSPPPVVVHTSEKLPSKLPATTNYFNGSPLPIMTKLSLLVQKESKEEPHIHVKEETIIKTKNVPIEIPKEESKIEEINISSIRPISPIQPPVDHVSEQVVSNLNQEPIAVEEPFQLSKIEFNIRNEFPIEEPVMPKSEETVHEEHQSPIHSFVDQNTVNENVNDKDLKSKLKTYIVEKSPNYFGFGIILHTEKDDDDENEVYFPLVEIEKNSPAETAGLQNNQRLIAVDNQYINTDLKTVEELAELIDDCFYTKESAEVIVLDPEVWDLIKDDNDLMISLYEILENSSNKTVISEQNEVNTITEPPLTETNSLKNINPEPENVETINPEAITVETIIPEIITNVVEPEIKPKLNDSIIPRFCHLVRKSRDDQYGFDFKTLKNESKHIATNVREGLSAHQAGLRNGDFILEINMAPVETVEHEKVVDLIYSREKDVDLLVVEDLKGYKNILAQQEKLIKSEKKKLVKQNSTISSAEKNISYHKVALMETYRGIGLHLSADGKISYIEPLSPADISGLRKEQKIAYINNVDVRDMGIQNIAKLIKENMNNLIVGVDDKNQSLNNTFDDNNDDNDDKDDVDDDDDIQTEDNKSAKVIEYIKVDKNDSKVYENIDNDSDNLPSTSSQNQNQEENNTRICNLVVRPDFEGFGFVLKKSKNPPHEIANISPNSPAAISGLENGDLLLKINGVAVVNEKYPQVVLLVKNGINGVNGLTRLEVIRPELFKKTDDIDRIESVNDTEKPLKTSSVKSNDYFKNESFKNKSVQSLPEYSNITDEEDETTKPATSSTIKPSIKSIPKKTVSLNNLNTENVSTLGSKQADKSSTMSMNTLKNAPKFKRCTLMTSANYSGFGFKINKELKPKYMICGVEENSPASRANICENDILIEINNKNIRRSKFDKVRLLLSDANKKGSVELLVISMIGYKWYKAKNKRFSQKLATTENVEFFSTASNPEPVRESNRDNRDSLQNNYESLDRNFREVSVDEDLISITVTKRLEYNGFGMALAVSNAKSNNKSSFPVITNIEVNSPASESGLKKNDELVEINGNKTIQQQDSKISGFIKSSGPVMKLLVRRKKDKSENGISNENGESDDHREIIPKSSRNLNNSRYTDDENTTANNYMNDDEDANDSQNYENVSFKANKIEMSSSKIQPNSPKLEGSVENSNEPVPRLCRVRAYGANLGFFVLASKKKLGVFKVSDIGANSPAYHSGLRNGDFIIEINGINVQSMNYDDLINLIKVKKEEDNLQMLVADEITVDWYAKRNTPINSSMVKKITYIETILQDEMDKNIVDSLNTTNRESQSTLDNNSGNEAD